MVRVIFEKINLSLLTFMGSDADVPGLYKNAVVVLKAGEEQTEAE